MTESKRSTRVEPNCTPQCMQSEHGECEDCHEMGQVGIIAEGEKRRCIRCLSGDPSADINEEWAAHLEECPNFALSDEEKRHREKGATLVLNDGTQMDLSNAQLGTICAGIMLAVGSAHGEPAWKIERAFSAAELMHQRMGTPQCQDLVRKFKKVLNEAFPMSDEDRRQMEASEGIMSLLKKALGNDVEIINAGAFRSRDYPH